MQCAIFQLRGRELFFLKYQRTFLRPPSANTNIFHPPGLGWREFTSTSRSRSTVGARLFPLVLEKLVQEPAGAVLVWQGAGRVQAEHKACPKPGGCCRAGARLLHGAGTWGTCWAGARHRCSPCLPLQQLPSSETDLFFYSFHTFYFFSAKKGKKNPVLCFVVEQAFHQRAAGVLPARPPL